MSPDGEHLAVVSEDQTISVWKLFDGCTTTLEREASKHKL